MPFKSAISLAILSCVAAIAEPLSFEVASVKPAAPQEANGRIMINNGRGGPGSSDPTRLTFTNVSLMSILTRAYNVKNYQVTGPAWLDSERYDIIAKVPPDTTKEQSNIMLQNLLAERFHLALHHDSKEFQGYELVVGKNGPKLKASSPEDAAFDQSAPMTAPPGPPERDANGFPKLDRPGLIMMMKMGGKGTLNAHMTARAQTVAQLLNMIGGQLNRPVTDNTGLTGKYDFSLDYGAENAGLFNGGALPPPPPPPGGGGQGQVGEAQDELAPTLTTAIQQQLGLRLDAKKIQLDVLIVDKADKVPTEN